MFYKIKIFRNGKELGYFDGINAGGKPIIKNDSETRHIEEIEYYLVLKVLNENNYSYQLIKFEI